MGVFPSHVVVQGSLSRPSCHLFSHDLEGNSPPSVEGERNQHCEVVPRIGSPRTFSGAVFIRQKGQNSSGHRTATFSTMSPFRTRAKRNARISSWTINASEEAGKRSTREKPVVPVEISRTKTRPYWHVSHRYLQSQTGAVLSPS